MRENRTITSDPDFAYYFFLLNCKQGDCVSSSSLLQQKLVGYLLSVLACQTLITSPFTVKSDSTEKELLPDPIGLPTPLPFPVRFLRWAYSPIICLRIPLPLFDLASIVFLPWWISSLLFTKSMESWVMVECWSIRKFVEWFNLL